MEHMSKKKLRKQGTILEPIVFNADVVQGAESLLNQTSGGGNEDVLLGTVLPTDEIATTKLR